MRNFLLMFFIIALTAFSITGCERAMTKPVIDAVTPTEMPTMDNPEAFTVAFVQAAINLYKMEGREAAIAYCNDPASINGQWYVFILDANDLFVAQPAAQGFVGKGIRDLPGLDGSLIGLEITMATEEGRWTEYLWPNPENNKVEFKRTWSIRHDGYLFGSGYYESWGPDPATLTLASKDDPVAFTHDFVLASIARYEFEGLEATAAYYNDPMNIDGQWYVFITDENDMFVAHAPRQDFIGTDLKDVVGGGGFRVGAEIAKATGTGHWTKYLGRNPATGEVELKRTWAIRHDGYLFGSGYYKPVVESSIPAVEGSIPEEN